MVRKLLKIIKSTRQGKTAGGGADIIGHPWSDGFDSEELIEKKVEAPIDPQVGTRDPPEEVALGLFVPWSRGIL